MKNAINTDNVQYMEIKETPANSDKIREAKERELKNFDDYEAYEEVEDKGQDVLGTRYVMSIKPDGSIKARFVTKGFQENLELPSDSPTSSRETIKLFSSIAANEEWPIESSDIRSAFLQSEKLDREVFVEPPPERKKPGIIWRTMEPCRG